MTGRFESKAAVTIRVVTRRLLITSTVCCLLGCSAKGVTSQAIGSPSSSAGIGEIAPGVEPEVEESVDSATDPAAPPPDATSSSMLDDSSQPPTFPDTPPGAPPGYQAPPPGDAVAVDGVLGLYGESNEFRSCDPDYRGERWAVSAAGSAFTFANTWYEAQPELELCAVPGNPTPCFVYYSGRAVVGELGEMDLFEHPRLDTVDRQAVFTELATLRVAQSLDDCP